MTGTDYTCPSSLTSFIQHGGDAAMGGNRIYAGGNERVAVRMNSVEKFGIDPNRSPIRFGNTVLAPPTMGGAVEIMSEAATVLELYVTMLFEYVPKATPGYRDANLVWVDVTNCAKESDFKPGQGVYQRASRGFTMKEDGRLVFATGHMHDGGVRVELLVNGKVSCNSKQIYANRRGHYVEPADGTAIIKGLAMPPGSHISDVGVCKDWGEVKKGDVLSVKAYYDEGQHMQMKKASGVLEAQMGIMWTYIGIK